MQFRHEIHSALLKRLVQRPSRPRAEIRIYDCNLFKTVLLVIYITNLYYRKISAFIPFEDEILVKKTPTYLQWTLILIFCVDVHMGLDPLPPSTCIHLSLTPYPL